MTDTTSVNEMTWEQRCAVDAEARDWAEQYGRSEFYWSAKWGRLTAVADGTTTLTDVADAVAAGTATPYQEALAASYWDEAAEYLVVQALGEHEGLVDDLGQVPWLVDDDELAATERRAAEATAALVEARQIRNAAVEREHDQRRWDHAPSEEAYHQARSRAALEAEVAGPWKTAVDVAYDQVCADYGNDGHPDNDRHLSAQDTAAQQAAIHQIAQKTGLAPGEVAGALRDVADRYGRSDGTDGASLAQPDWDQVAHDWAEMADVDVDAARLDPAEVARVYDYLFDQDYYAEIEGDGAREDAYHDSVYDQAQTLVTQGYTVTSIAALDTEARAHTATDTAGEAAGGVSEAPDPTVDEARRFPDDHAHAGHSPVGPDPWRPPPADEFTHRVAVTAAGGLGAEDAAAAGAAARSALAARWAAADVPDDPAADHVEYWERVAAGLEPRSAAAAAADTQAWLAHNAPEAAAGAPDTAATTPGDALSAPDPEGLRLYTQMLLEQARREVEAGIDVGRVIGADAVLAEMVDAIAGSSHDGGAHGGQVTTGRGETTGPDPVWSRSGAERVLDDLDQARAQLEAGDVAPEREYELVEYIEHLAELAEGDQGAAQRELGTLAEYEAGSTEGAGLTDMGSGDSPAPAGAAAQDCLGVRWAAGGFVVDCGGGPVGWFRNADDAQLVHDILGPAAGGDSADEALGALLADLDATAPDPYPGDEAYQAQLADQGDGFGPVDSQDRMLARHDTARHAAGGRAEREPRTADDAVSGHSGGGWSLEQVVADARAAVQDLADQSAAPGSVPMPVLDEAAVGDDAVVWGDG